MVAAALGYRASTLGVSLSDFSRLPGLAQPLASGLAAAVLERMPSAEIAMPIRQSLDALILKHLRDHPQSTAPIIGAACDMAPAEVRSVWPT